MDKNSIEITNLPCEACGVKPSLCAHYMNLPLKLCFPCRRNLEVYLSGTIDHKIWNDTGMLMTFPAVSIEERNKHQEIYRLHLDATNILQFKIIGWINAARKERGLSEYSPPVQVDGV